MGETNLGRPGSDLQLHLVAVLVPLRVVDGLRVPPGRGVRRDRGSRRSSAGGHQCSLRQRPSCGEGRRAPSSSRCGCLVRAILKKAGLRARPRVASESSSRGGGGGDGDGDGRAGAPGQQEVETQAAPRRREAHEQLGGGDWICAGHSTACVWIIAGLTRRLSKVIRREVRCCARSSLRRSKVPRC